MSSNSNENSKFTAPTHKSQRGAIVWFTGLSGAGKSTLSRALRDRLIALGRPAYILDGDVIRTGLCSDLGYTLQDRSENVRRVGEVAKLMADAGIVAVVALISPIRAERDRVRHSMKSGVFIEVFANASLETCEKRDVKGLYARARANEVANFTGISSPYEPPINPEIDLRTDQYNCQECIDRLLAEMARLLTGTAPDVHGL